MPIKNEDKEKLVRTLTTNTNGRSYADLQQICHEAAIKCLRESITNQFIGYHHFYD